MSTKSFLIVNELFHIVHLFDINSNVLSITSYGNGHINDTYLVLTQDGNGYILQRINHYVFKNIDQLMHNIDQVTKHISQIMVDFGINPKHKVLNIIPSKTRYSYIKTDLGYFRMYDYIPNSIGYDIAKDEHVIKNAGKAFGLFQKYLNGFNPNLLYETIPSFHDTKKRYQNFQNALSRATKDRINQSRVWIDEIMNFEPYISLIVDQLESKNIPLRVTHNDTKLNNVLFNIDTSEILSVIDLDTVMPGSILYDFGDMVRIGCNAANEDEKDLEKIKFNLSYFEALTQGFLDELKNVLTDLEIDLLPIGAIVMTIEVGMRFLTDYLEHDQYFKIKYENHNLDRAINQITFAKILIDHLDDMNEIITKYKRKP